MWQIKKIIVVIVCLLVSVGALADSSNTQRKSTKDVFDVLFYGLDLHETKVIENMPYLSKSNTDDILTFLNSFPMPSNKIYDSLSCENKCRFIQSNYGKYFMVFNFGNEADQWYGKLYSVSFTILFPNKEIPEDETRVFSKLKQLYGDYTQIEKFRYSEERVNENLNLYIWQSPDVVIAYRSNYSLKRRETMVNFHCWDKEFYNSHHYYEW